MADSEQVVENDGGSSLIEQLGRALHELEACKDSSKDKVQWMEIEEHFRYLETMLKRKSEELEARVKEYEDKEAETHALLAEREAAVVTKELELLDRVQELKDAAVSAVAEARANHQPSSLECLDGGDNVDSKVSSSLAEINSTEEYSPQKVGENADGVAADVKPRPALTQFCEQMDAKGLLSFAMENQKILYAIRDELSVALEIATEPARLVLDLLNGPVETTQQMDKNDAAFQGMLKSCIIFMEAMAALLARIDPGADHLLNLEIKQQAKAIADEWKPKLASTGTDATNGNPLEAEAFLQLLSTFKIASEFDEDELCKLVLLIAQRRQAPELCHSLGLTHKIPGVVESLLNNGNQIDAVRFIHAFQLTESFPPVPLLKTYLKDLRRNSQNTQRKGGNSGGGAGVQVDGNALELAALKVVIRCVEEYKLEADYPLDPLQKRLAQLEKSKSDKKRAGDFVKHYQSKKPKANRGYRGLQGAATGPAGGWHAPPPWTVFIGMPHERYPQTVPSQSAYGQQANDQRMYYNPQDDRVAAASSYNAAAPPNYGSYIGAGIRSSHQPYI